jgi:hypothetical protein
MSGCCQLGLGSFQMDASVLLPLQGCRAHRVASQHDQWHGYMTILVVNLGIMKSISMLTTVIQPMIKFDVDTPRDCFFQEVKLMLAIC